MNKQALEDTTMEYQLSITKNEALTHTIMWVNPESIMISERSQSQKVKHGIFKS